MTSEEPELREVRAVDRPAPQHLWNDIPGASECALVVIEAETGRVTAMSNAVERLSGFTREQVVGRPAWETLVPTEHIGMLAAASAACLSTDRPMNMVGPIRTVAGETLDVEWFTAPLAERGDDRPTQVLFYADPGEDAGGAPRLFAHLMHDAARTAVLTTDLQGVVTFVSTGAAALFGLRSHELVGAPFPLAMLDAEQVEERAAIVGVDPGLRLLLADPTLFERRTDWVDLGELDRRRRTGVDRPERQATDWTMRRADGRMITVSVATSELHDHAGRLIGHLSVGEDVTEIRASRALLVSALRTERESVERLRELDRAKNEFVATVSHELRTPMTSIVGYVEHLRDEALGPLTPAQARALDAVGRNAARLNALADDLLTLLGLESEHEPPSFTTVAVTDLFEAVKADLPALTAGRDLCVEVVMPEPALTVPGDQRLLERALHNLVSNAVKFTEDGGRVELSARVVDEAVVLEVTDSGIGMDADEKRHVFGRFARAAQAQARAIPGTGLGLCLVDAIVREHGGQVLVESETGVGSVFSILLPAAPPASAEESA